MYVSLAKKSKEERKENHTGFGFVFAFFFFPGASTIVDIEPLMSMKLGST